METPEIYIETAENNTNEPFVVENVARLCSGARIVRSTVKGAINLERLALLGPETTIGRYCSINQNSFVIRATIGGFCAIGANVFVNPFNHPTDWLSIHELQYSPHAWDWRPEFRGFERLDRTPDMFKRVSIGNDVWIGHNANILGANIGDGGVVGAGSVVTKDVPPYAIVAGTPATIRRFRFSDAIIERLLRLKWWDLELGDLSGLPFRDIERCLDRIEEIRGK